MSYDNGTFESKIKSLMNDVRNSREDDGERTKKLVSIALIKYRRDNKLTQEELAKRLDIPKLQITRWEKLQNKPGRAMLRILEAYGIIEKEEG